jgi:hypothetical protein
VKMTFNILAQRKPSKSIFELENHVSLANPLIHEALSITERLLNDNEFFVKTSGAVLSNIGQHYKMTDLYCEDLIAIRDKLAPIRVVSGISSPSPESVYMICHPKIRQIDIESDVRSVNSSFAMFCPRLTNQHFLFQWLSKGEVILIERPNQAELNRHELMLVISFIHETHHTTTKIFLDSDTDSVPVKYVELEASDTSGIKSIAPNPGGPQQKRTTPPHIGTCTFEGQDIGDSGFALEDIIFGGRIGHVEPGAIPFEVHALNSARCVVWVSDINILLDSQMSGLFAYVQVEERPAKPQRLRLNDEYVSRLLDCLKHGRCFPLLFSHHIFI